MNTALSSHINPATLPLPDFAQLSLSAIEQQVKNTLTQAQQFLAQFPATVVDTSEALALIQQLDSIENQLQQHWGVLSHLNAVNNSPELRDLHQKLLPQLSDYYTQLGQHQTLFQTYCLIQSHEDFFEQLSQAQQRAIELAIRDFKLSGVALNSEDKARYAAISAQLSKLSSDFSNHVLDATQAWSLNLNEEQLAGIPPSSQALFKQLATQHKQDGWLATLDFPSYYAIITHANDRNLRENIYRAYVTRASEHGDPQLDNSHIMQEILALRQEMAALLGFSHYADYSLASKMAPSVAEVEKFLYALADHAKQPARKELEQLQTAAQQDGISQLQPWDIPYYAEKIKQREFQLSQEDLKPYFPAPVAIQGIFSIVEKLYGIHIEEKQTSTWHPDVHYYEVSEHGAVIAGFYFDLYARSNKRGGAWMSGFRSRMQTKEGIQHPVAFMVANFTPAISDQPALLSHDELVTLLHEFGHGLHHMLTEVDVIHVAGTHGVAWDAVELPSQFMEFWAWDNTALTAVSQHVQDQTTLPTHLLEALLAARYFQTGMQTLRQLEFALFDLKVHQLPKPSTSDIQHTLNHIRSQVSVTPQVDYNRFQHSFSHIFAGGYAAGYYSYKWAEVLASDAFDRFEQEGIFNADTGKAFRQSILAVGGSVDALNAFQEFRGREAQLRALLRHNGWLSDTNHND